MVRRRAVPDLQARLPRLSRIRVLPKRGVYFLRLQYRHFLDFWRRASAREERPPPLLSDKDHDSVARWRRHLNQVRPLLRTLRLDLCGQVVARRADAVLKRRLWVLGQEYRGTEASDGSGLGSVMPWHLDPASGYRWPRDIWYRHVRKRVPAGVDIKLPWELSRCQHFLTLGEAYERTGDERYAKEYCEQVRDWVAVNPVRFGPNWACTMDVGIRIGNWLVALLYFAESPHLDDRLLALLLRSAGEHGRHITENLERRGALTSNHYMGNIAGLYLLGALCPVLGLAAKWHDFAQRELEREILRQTFEDGWDFESSTAYHRLVTEMLLYPFLIGEALGEPFSDRCAARLRSMVEAMGYATKPNGRIPQIGDNDSGRFLVFGADRDADDLDAHYLAATAGRNARIAPRIEAGTSVAFRSAGRFIFRSDRVYLMMVAGPKGQAGCGGHAHNDLLSYELSVDGQDIVVDPGTCVYTRDPHERNRSRSVANHNTLCWEGVEPCSLRRGLFELREEGTLCVETCDMGGPEECLAAVYHYGDRSHRREITFLRDEGRVVVSDVCSHSGAMLSFVCAPGVEPRLTGEGFWAGTVVFRFDGIRTMRTEPGQYSPGYGRSSPTSVIRAWLAGTECTHEIGCSAG